MNTDANQSLRGVVVGVVNIAGGGCDAGSAARMVEVFAAAGLVAAEVVSVEPADIDAALEAAAARADVLVVLGGDGTIRTAATLCGKAGKLLIPLAGGTLNMLPHAIYGPVPWEAALADTLAAPRIRVISGGDAGGHRFFCAAVLGAPSLWADAREALRHGDLVESAERAVTALRRHGDALAYQFGDEPENEAEAVVVMCPLVSRGLDSDAATLEASALDAVTGGAMLSLAFHAIFDDWRRDPSVVLAHATRIQVSGHGELPGILDGETTPFDREVTLSYVPAAFRVLAPDHATP